MAITYVRHPEPWDPRQPQGRSVILRPAEVRATIAFLRACQAARAAGVPVSYATDPEWLVDVAINRRAGWPEDPHAYASCMPVDASMRYPKRALHDETRWLLQTAHHLNGTRVRLHPHSVPQRYRARLAHRLWSRDDF